MISFWESFAKGLHIVARVSGVPPRKYHEQIGSRDKNRDLFLCFTNHLHIFQRDLFAAHIHLVVFFLEFQIRHVAVLGCCLDIAWSLFTKAE